MTAQTCKCIIRSVNSSFTLDLSCHGMVHKGCGGSDIYRKSPACQGGHTKLCNINFN